jgi:hypothetical protein
MAMVLCCTTVLVVTILLSARAYAASLISQFEYHSFWSDILPIILMAGLAIVVTWRLRKWTRQQVALAPPEANRNPRERRLHRLSLVLIAAPMFYAFLFESDLFLPFLAVLAAQAVALAALRALGLPFGWRLFSILPVGLLSVLAGAFALSALTLPPAVDQAWVLATSATSFALGALLSYLSFPSAYRERGW